MSETAIFIYIALVLVPALPLLLTWRKVLTRRDSLAASSLITVKLPLLVITASSLLSFVNLLFYSSTKGVRYSEGRFIMIVTAFGVSLGMIPFSVVGKRNPFKWSLIITSAALTVVWLYLWAMSAVA
jgi:hypothetical protein